MFASQYLGNWQDIRPTKVKAKDTYLSVMNKGCLCRSFIFENDVSVARIFDGIVEFAFYKAYLFA